MVRVGIRELKAHLSEYIRAGRAGEQVVITERGADVAQLTSLDQEESGLRALIEQGVVQWSGTEPDLGETRPVKVEGEALSATVLDQRGPR